MPIQRYTADEGATWSGTDAVGLWSSATTDRTDRQTRQGNLSAGRPGRRSASPGDRSAAGGPGGGCYCSAGGGTLFRTLSCNTASGYTVQQQVCATHGSVRYCANPGYQGLIPF